MEFDRAVAQLEELVAELERDGDERALLLLQLIDAIHRPAIVSLASGKLDNPTAQAVMAMYGLVDDEDDEPAREGIPLPQIQHVAPPTRSDAAGADLEAGELRAIDAHGGSVLLLNADGELHAFRNECPVDGRPLDGGKLSGPVLVCPWHNCAYDVRSGRRVDDQPDAAPLAPVPLEAA